MRPSTSRPSMPGMLRSNTTSCGIAWGSRSACSPWPRRYSSACAPSPTTTTSFVKPDILRVRTNSCALFGLSSANSTIPLSTSSSLQSFCGCPLCTNQHERYRLRQRIAGERRRTTANCFLTLRPPCWKCNRAIDPARMLVSGDESSRVGPRTGRLGSWSVGDLVCDPCPDHARWGRLGDGSDIGRGDHRDRGLGGATESAQVLEAAVAEAGGKPNEHVFALPVMRKAGVTNAEFRTAA